MAARHAALPLALALVLALALACANPVGAQVSSQNKSPPANAFCSAFKGAQSKCTDAKTAAFCRCERATATRLETRP